MLWIVQNNLYNENGYVRFLDALVRFNCDHIIVKPVPFTSIILPADFDSMTQDVETTPEPEFDQDQKIMVMGATSLTRIAKERGWTPGTYLNENFDFSVWRDGFGKRFVLNYDATVGTVFDIEIPKGDWLFARPVLDSKSFTGTLFSAYDLGNWLQSVSVIEEEEFQPLHKNTEIMIASAKTIYAEYRMFVVNDRVVTGSLYKSGNTVRADENVDQDVIDFTKQMVKKWTPAKAFVIDIARTPDGLKVIEINNINSSGFYAANVQKIVKALDCLEN